MIYAIAMAIGLGFMVPEAKKTPREKCGDHPVCERLVWKTPKK
jgi:hypothetical protein